MVMLPTRRGRNTLRTAPIRPLEDIYDRMGQLMNVAFGDLALDSSVDMPWVPPAEILETNDAYMVVVEVPGVSRDQLDVQLMDRELTITGETSESTLGRRHRSSRRTGQFEFRTLMPGDIRADDVRAELADGVLTIAVPKSQAPGHSRIEVSQGKAASSGSSGGSGSGGSGAGQPASSPESASGR
jgi:HSP20 family protein